MMQIVILPKANKQPTMKSAVKWTSVKDIMVRESLHVFSRRPLSFANSVYSKQVTSNWTQNKQNAHVVCGSSKTSLQHPKTAEICLVLTGMVVKNGDVCGNCVGN